MSRREFKTWAADHKTGMTVEELRNALSQLPDEGNFYVKVGKAGFRQQLQAIVFIEAEVPDEAAPAPQA
jgi:hypothetical protein